jgi:arylsulfatase A-like enzyme
VDLKRVVDRPIAQLIRDLEERGLLDRTLVVIASEFGRDMMIEGKPGLAVKDQVQQPAIMTDIKHYGMHRHFTEASSVLMFGGGTPKGKLHGQTADERPCRIVKDPVTIEDLHATIYKTMGIAPDSGLEIEKRPFYVTKDGKGKPVEALA